MQKITSLNGHARGATLLASVGSFIGQENLLTMTSKIRGWKIDDDKATKTMNGHDDVCAMTTFANDDDVEVYKSAPECMYTL